MYTWRFLCILTAGALESPQFLSADVTGVGEDEDDWIVTVEWSEPVISCAGSVSQYVLTVTPPTPDCGSEDCVFMTEETQYSLTLTVDQTYSLTIRADTCPNTQTGDDSDPVSLTIYGEILIILLTVCTLSLCCRRHRQLHCSATVHHLKWNIG